MTNQEKRWGQFFVTSLVATGKDGHIAADRLRYKIESHDGSEAYHCAFDLEPREDFSGYVGPMRPALGYVWFDFDSHDGAISALNDARKFVEMVGADNAFVAFSGSKGFHIGVPFDCFGLDPSPDLGKRLQAIASKLKTSFPTLDTTIYNANRKFRVLGSRHPKTGLFKTRINAADLFQFDLSSIKNVAKERGALTIPVPERHHVLDVFKGLLEAQTPSVKSAPSANGNAKTWIAPSGDAAFKQCGFLQRCRDNQATITEPEWYAALSIVSRFQDGRKQCHGISHKHPGYSVSECNAKIDQALSESAPRTCDNVSTLWDGCARCPLYGKINSPVNIFDRRFWDLSSKGNLIPKYEELLEHFCKQNAYKTIADMKAVYVYTGTHYVEYTPIEIKAFAENSFSPKPQERHRQEFTHKVFANFVDKRNFFVRSTENHLNFRNGILDLESSNLLAHSPVFGFRGILPYDFDPNAQSPTFDWWIRDVMCGDEELVKILQEFMGYVVRGGEYKYHKALWLSGSGRNGKSTFLSVLKALIGAGNYSTLSIRQIISDKFSSADLDGKTANFSEETSPEELSDSGPFKNLTGDGELLAQKKYGDPYSFRNRAKLIMTYNEVPELRDLSPGMLSRPIIIPWKKDLTELGSQDRTLKDKLLLELPGIFNFAMEGWRRLEEQSEFTQSAKSSVELQNVRDASCSALQWVSHNVTFLPIDPNSSNQVSYPTDLYEAYAEGEKFPYKAVKFWRRINEHPEIKKRRRETKRGSEYFSMLIRSRSSHSASVGDQKRSTTTSHHLPPSEY